MEQQIISSDQYERILQLYPSKKFGIGVLPIFGGLLVGLGLLTFVAANWQDIPQWIRLAIIVAVMCGFYGAGEACRTAGNHRVGEALIGAGLLSFGAGIFLVAQMYHLTSYSVLSFLVWGAAGVVLTYIYRSRFMFVLSAIILAIAQFYGQISFTTFSYAAALLTLIALGGFVYTRRKFAESMILSIALLVHTLFFLYEIDVHYLWFYVYLAALYTLSDWMPISGAQRGFRFFSAAAGFLFGIWVVLIYDDQWLGYQGLPNRIYWLLIPIVILFAFSVWKKLRNTREKDAAWTILDWLPLLPLFLIQYGIGYVYLIALAIFSIYLLFYGYHLQHKRYAHAGTIGFIIVVLFAYTKLTWAFMDKSLFFVSAGLLLLGLSWLLYKRNKAILVGNEEEDEA